MGKVVTKIIDAIFGTDWTSGLSSLQDSVLSWGKNENAITLDRTAPTMDYRIAYSDAWNSGYDFGEGIADKVNGIFGSDSDSSLDAFNLGNTLEGIYNNTSDIAGNAARTADSMDYTEEDMKYLKDIAEREAINCTY